MRHHPFVAALVLLLAACMPRGGSSLPDAAFKPFDFAILEDWDKSDDLDDVARDFALFRELGVTTWRGSLGWDDYEPSPGRMDTTWLEAFVSRAARDGIVLRPYVGYTPAWAASGGTDGEAWNDPPRSLDEWRRFVTRLTGLLARHPNVRSLEIYNEENAALWWDGSADEYAAVLRAGAESIRRVAPRLQVIVGGLVWPDAAWLETSCARGTGATVDVIAVHAYPETWTPDSVPLERWLDRGFVSDFLPAADSACGRKPIWVNETGFATVPGRTELQQATWWVRAVATFAALPRVEQVGIYEIKDQRPGTAVIGDAPNYFLGLTRADRTPKLAFRTVRMLVRLYGGGRVAPMDSASDVRVRQGSVDSVFRHVVVRTDGGQVLVAWSRGLPAVVDLTWPRAATTVREYRVDGTAVAAPRSLVGIALAPGLPRIFEALP